MQVDAVFDHLVSWDGTAFDVFRVGQSGIRKVEGCVDLFRSECGQRWVDDHPLLADVLHQPGSMFLV